jgi:hypothetical protein
MEILILAVQAVFPEVIFLSSSYVLLMLIFYIMFHSTLFNEATGCQTGYAFESRFSDNVRSRKKFYVGYAIIPAMNHATDEEEEMSYNEIISDICRQLEIKNHGIHIFNLGMGSFSFIYEENHGELSVTALNDYISTIMQ